MLTIEPPPFAIMPGRNALIVWNIALALIVKLRSQASSSHSRIVPAWTQPAQLNSTSIGPSASASARTPGASVTSSGRGSQPATSAQAPGCRSVAITRAPSRANSSALARPMPCAAPVITAVLPASRPAMSCPASHHEARAERVVIVPVPRVFADQPGGAAHLGVDRGRAVTLLAAHDARLEDAARRALDLDDAIPVDEPDRVEHGGDRDGAFAGRGAIDAAGLADRDHVDVGLAVCRPGHQQLLERRGVAGLGQAARHRRPQLAPPRALEGDEGQPDRLGVDDGAQAAGADHDVGSRRPRAEGDRAAAAHDL